MGKVLPSQRLLKQFEERLVFGDMNLSEIVRSGAQMMLQYALEREVTEALGRGYYENAPETTKEKGRRNGYESHRVLTGEGAVTVQVPQIRETSTGFRSKILDAYVSRTEKLDELIARMYVHGMSTRDIEATFADVLSGTGVSKSVVSRVTQCLSDDFEVFRKRDLSSEELLYLELDGTFLRYHQGAEKKEPILVATGYRIDGTRVLLHIGVGNGESYANWKGFLQEMVARGLREPLLIVTDGNPGVLKAIEEVFPQSLKQRCQKHRLENILGKAPKEIHDELKAEILESFHAKSYEQGLKKGREVITRYRQRFPRCTERFGTYSRAREGRDSQLRARRNRPGTRVRWFSISVILGNGESYALNLRREFLQEMVARGLREPLLIVTDGNPGVLKAIEEVFPQSLKQRCQKHRLENILGKAPKEIHDELKAEILESFHAKSYEQGLKKGREVITRYRQRFPSAMNGMEETLEACLQVLRLPEAHHKRLRTSNLLERTFGELKRRTKVIPHFFTEQAAIKLSFAVLLATASKWRGVRMDVFTIRRIEELRNEFLPKSTSEEPAA